jgi:diguanylate cyclase (GGDEF)-like protein
LSEDDASPKVPAGLIGTDEFLGGYRHQIVLYIAIIVFIGATPFAIDNFLIGYPAMGTAILTLIGCFAIDGVAVHLKRRPPIPLPLLILPLGAAVAMAIATHGLPAVLWCTPAVMFCYLVMSWRAAMVVSCGLAVLFAGLLYHYVDAVAAARYVGAACISIAAVNLVVRIVNNLQNRLLGQIVTDPLTGAYNRRQMDTSLAEAIERNRRTGAPASILMIDLDHFKQINDAFGHPVGDEVLKGLVTLVSEKSRKLDRLFRMGGEEFLLLLPDTKGSDAVLRAENLRRMVAAAPLLPKRPVTASIGVSELAGDTAANTWIKRADDALYRAKQDGRDRVVAAPSPAPAPNPFASVSSQLAT